MCNATFLDGPDAVRALAAALAGLTGLTRLELCHNEGFGEDGAIAFAYSLRSLSRLQYLDYSSCCAEGGGMAALCHSLRGLPRLQHLNLANNQKAPHNQMGDCSEIAAPLGPSLPSLTALTLLDLSCNDLDVGVAAAMAPGGCRGYASSASSTTALQTVESPCLATVSRYSMHDPPLSLVLVSTLHIGRLPTFLIRITNALARPSPPSPACPSCSH